MTVDHAAVIEALRAAGARFALVHGSRAGGQRPRPDSDLDVGAWWGTGAPDPWEVRLPGYVDLVVLDTAPLWLAGRVAQYGQLLFDDDPAARVAWQADTRLRYVDELPAVRARYRQRREQLARGTGHVDQERVDRLLTRVAADLRELAGYRRRGAELLDGRTELAAAKYYRLGDLETFVSSVTAWLSEHP